MPSRFGSPTPAANLRRSGCTTRVTPVAGIPRWIGESFDRDESVRAQPGPCAQGRCDDSGRDGLHSARGYYAKKSPDRPAEDTRLDPPAPTRSGAPRYAGPNRPRILVALLSTSLAVGSRGRPGRRVHRPITGHTAPWSRYQSWVQEVSWISRPALGRRWADRPSWLARATTPRA